MKVVHCLTFGCMAAGVLCQGIEIGAPLNSTCVSKGQNMTVEINRPDTLTGSTEVAIVIGFLNCFAEPCPDPMERVGTILHAGGYHPAFRRHGGWEPHQNFTVTIPETASDGVAQLNVIHFSLVGAGPFPFLQSLSVTLIVD